MRRSVASALPLPVGKQQMAFSAVLTCMMSHGQTTSTYDAAEGSVLVATPYAGDVVSGALHCAYDGRDELPDDWMSLLDCLDRID